MESLKQSRRRFLTQVTLLLAGGTFLGKYLSPRVNRRRQILSVSKDEVPPHGALVHREARIAVIRERGAYYALDLVCTHLGCTVGVTPVELVCPCHGSRFDRKGRVLQGPADRPLRQYRVEEHDGRLTVFA